MTLYATGTSLQALWSNDGTLQAVIEDDAANLADFLECCCDGSIGCCPEELLESVTLKIELLIDGVGCWTVGDTQNAPPDALFGWSTTDGFMANAAWRGLSITCVQNALHVTWNDAVGGSCPIKDTDPEGAREWTLVAGSCDPATFDFEYQVDEDDGTGTGCNDCIGTINFPGLTGLLKIRITVL